MPTNQIPPDIRTFLEGLLEDAGLQLTDDIKEEMIKDLYGRLEKKMIADAVEIMAPAEVEEFIKLVESKANNEQLNQFITSKIPSAQEVFMKSFVEFRELFLGGTTQPNEEPAV